MDLNPVTGVSSSKKENGGFRRRTGRTLCNDGGRGQSDTTTSQGLARIAGGTRSYERGMGHTLFQGLQKDALDLGLLPSRTVRDYISVILSHSICDTLLWKPWETYTGLTCVDTVHFWIVSTGRVNSVPAIPS